MTPDERISKYKGMMDWISRYWGSKYPHKADDLRGEAYKALVECAHNFEGEEELFTRYLKKTVHHTLKRFVYSDFLVRPPVGSRWVPKASDEELDLLFGIDIDDEYEPYEEPRHDYLKEIQESPNFTEFEKELLLKRSQGYTQHELGEYFGMKQRAIGSRLRGCKERLRRIFHG